MCLLVMLKYLLSSCARLLELGAVQPNMPLWQKAGRDTRVSYVQRGRVLTHRQLAEVLVRANARMRTAYGLSTVPPPNWRG